SARRPRGTGGLCQTAHEGNREKQLSVSASGKKRNHRLSQGGLGGYPCRRNFRQEEKTGGTVQQCSPCHSRKYHTCHKHGNRCECHMTVRGSRLDRGLVQSQ